MTIKAKPYQNSKIEPEDKVYATNWLLCNINRIPLKPPDHNKIYFK